MNNLRLGKKGVSLFKSQIPGDLDGGTKRNNACKNEDILISFE